MKIIEKHPEKRDWDYISSNPNILVEFIEKYIDKIDFRRLSQNKFTFEAENQKKEDAGIRERTSFHKLMVIL